MRLILALTGLTLLAAAPAAGSADYRVGESLKPAAKTRASSYREITWDDLIPPDWDPAASFKGLDFSRLKDSDPRAREALKKMRAAWDAAPVNAAMNGKKIRLAGFVIPLERKGEQVSELLLVPYFGACIHTPPPPANQTIHVILRKPISDIRMMDAFWVDGTLQLVRGDSSMGIYGYRLLGDRLERYLFGREP